MSWVIRGFGADDRVKVEYPTEQLLRRYFVTLLELPENDLVIDSYRLDPDQLESLLAGFGVSLEDSSLEYFLE